MDSTGRSFNAASHTCSSSTNLNSVMTCSFVPQTPPIAPPRGPIPNGRHSAEPVIEYESSQTNGMANVTPDSPDPKAGEKGSDQSSFTLAKVSGDQVSFLKLSHRDS